MSSDLVSLADASALLGVSVERVRQLVVSGQLPARRYGNAWAVERIAVDARRHSPGARGRPLSSVRAWDEIVSGQVDLRRTGRYRRRAELFRCEMSRADVDALPGLVGAVLGGARAAVEYGELLAPDDRADLYLPSSAFVGLGASVAFVADPLGEVSLRVVDDRAWGLVAVVNRLAPRGAVALDLVESGEPRHWIAAEHLMAGSD